jgi:hypothetical protein
VDPRFGVLAERRMLRGDSRASSGRSSRCRLLAAYNPHGDLLSPPKTKKNAA